MKKLVLPLAMLAMAALLGASVSVDCVRLASEAHGRVLLADAELLKQESRLVKLLSDSPKVSPEVQADLSAFKSAASAEGRHNAFHSLVASFHKTISGTVDATNPLDRKFMDDIAGAMNRREVAEKPYDEELAACQNYLHSWRGRVAQSFSSQARTDANSTAIGLPTIHDVERNLP